MKKKAIVIGAGIVGLSTARALALKNYDVTVIERTGKAVGASVRNFGMVWPIGQPDGDLFEAAMKSRGIWKQIAQETGCGMMKQDHCMLLKRLMNGDVLEELATIYKHRGYKLLDKKDTIKLSKFVTEDKLVGGLYSHTEMIINPRKAIATIPLWLKEKLNVKFIWGKAISYIQYPIVKSGNEEWQADEIYVCSGADFETLFPSVFAQMPVTKCKLQMMRMCAQPDAERIGPALCGGLSLIHYNSFKAATTLQQLQKYYQDRYPEYLKWGIHVMVSQNDVGELTVGDSHEYGLTLEPFDQSRINDLIISYLKGFARFSNEQIIETWNGTYAKSTDGEPWLYFSPEQGVIINNAFGGAGMTLSFGASEKLIS